ncbi:amino acid ABC transporter permease, partial [Campylobacter coli]
APFIIYGLIFFIFFLICYPVTLYSKKLEKKWS